MGIHLSYDESFDDFEGLQESENFYFDSEYTGDVDFSESDFDDFSPEYIHSLADQINHDIEGMSEKEAQSYLEQTFSEAFPLIPLITALAPMAIQAVSGLISNATRREPARRPAPPPRSPSQPLPRSARQAPTATTPRTYGGPVPGSTGSAGINASTLINLLQTPAVMNAIAGIVSSISGNSQAGAPDPQLGNLLLNTVSQLASNARSELFGEQEENYPDFLFDASGNLIVDPYAPEQVADLLIEKLDQ